MSTNQIVEGGDIGRRLALRAQLLQYSFHVGFDGILDVDSKIKRAMGRCSIILVDSVDASRYQLLASGER